MQLVAQLALVGVVVAQEVQAVELLAIFPKMVRMEIPQGAAAVEKQMEPHHLALVEMAGLPL